MLPLLLATVLLRPQADPCSTPLHEALRGARGAAALGPAPTLTFTSTPGHPYDAMPTPDGCWIFVSLTDRKQVAVYRRENGKLSLARTATLPGSPAGLAMTHDGKLLIAAEPDTNGIAFLDTASLTTGHGKMVLGDIDAHFPGAIRLAVSADDQFLYVAEESGAAVGVVNLGMVRASDYVAAAVTGSVPVGEGPNALAFSPDGKYLYGTSAIALPSRHDPASCNDAAGAGRHAPGELDVIQIELAHAAPAAAVVASTSAGCGPTGMALSPDGAIAYVSAAGENNLEVFDTAKLRTNPDQARLLRLPLGSAPQAVAVTPAGEIIAGLSATPSAKPEPGSLAVLPADWHLWSQQGAIHRQRAGASPRSAVVTENGSILLLTNYDSNQLEIVDLRRVPPKF